MKTILTALLTLFLFVPAAYSQDGPQRALFVSLIQKPQVLSSRKSIDSLIKYAQQARITILFVQVYRSNKSWFASKIADQTPYLDCLRTVGEDPLALLIEKAHSTGIKVHAWLNMLSLSANADAPILKKFGTDILTQNTEPKDNIEDYKIDEQYFLEPGDPRVREELTGIINELLLQYPKLDGIQFDYIRYPDKHPFYGHTKVNIERFKDITGAKSDTENSPLWQDWKRQQVTELLELLAAQSRKVHPDIEVSNTACVGFIRAYYEAFQDWPLWLNSGVVDFVTVMSYPSEFRDFQKYVLEAKTKVKDTKKLIIAVGAYKLINDASEFRRQLRYALSQGCRGFAVLHYGSLLENPQLGWELVNQGE